MKHRFFSVICLVSAFAVFPCFSSALFAQDPVLVGRPDFDQVNITPIIEYYEDSGRMQGVRDVTVLTEGWKTIGSNYLNFGYTDSAYWFRFSLNNTSKEPIDFLMELNYPHLKFIDLYEQQGEEYALLRKTGDGYPFHLRDVQDRCFVFRLKMNPGANSIYFRIYNNSPLKFKCTLYSEDDFIRYKNIEAPLYWLYFGVFSMMVILSFFMFIRLMKLSYLFLSLYILSLAEIIFFLNGFAFQYLWPEAALWNKVSSFVFMPCVIIFLTLFVSSFMGTFRGSLLIKRTICPMIIAPGVALALMYMRADTSVIYRMIFTGWVVAGIVLLFLAALWGAAHRDRPSRAILVSFTMFFCGVIVYAMMDFSIIPYSDLNEWSLQLGSLMMILMIIFGIASDMKKDREDLEASEKRLSTILETTREGFIEIGDELTIIDVNPALCTMLGYSRDEVLGKSIYGFIDPKERESLDIQTEMRRKGVSASYELNLKSSDGSMLHVMISASPVFDRHRKVTGTTVMISDISELKKREETILRQRDQIQAAYEQMEAANEELNASNEEYEAMNEELLETQSELLESEKRLKASLDEKELLLKEIHHRVKNNMQVMSSLLHLQSQYIFDERDRELFIVSENRVRSMAMVHQKIYQSPNLSKVDFSDYITELVDDLFLVYSIDKNRVSVSVNANNISLGVDLAIPCALIVNEAVTNAIKHAFPSGRSGSIGIDFIDIDGSYSLTVKDDGPGFSHRGSEENKETLGVQLMKALAVQLKGTFELSSNSGTAITIVFPHEWPADS